MPELDTSTRSGPASDDSLARIARMSTTAGVASSDYVAVNGLAVVSCILAAGTVLVFVFDNPVWLIVPGVAIVCSILALMQIRGSNGTQTGRLLVAASVLISVAVAGAWGGRWYRDKLAEERSSTEVEARLAELSSLLAKKEFDKAYALFTPDFRDRVNRQIFDQQWAGWTGIEQKGKFTGLKSSGRFKFARLENGATRGDTKIRITYERDQSAPIDVVVRRDGDNWYFWHMEIFQVARPDAEEGGDPAADPGDPTTPTGPLGPTLN